MLTTKSILHFFLVFFLILILSGCEAIKPKKVDQRQMPDGAEARARKNIEEGRGVKIGSVIGGRSGTNYEFSTSNPLWRASLETLDFLPLTTVDYSGGTIITDWYSDDSDTKSSLKITIRFLSNEITANSLKIIVHKKNCKTINSCSVKLLEKTKIKEELNSVIIKKAALLDKEKIKKK